jgi:hypothetical protein
MNSLKLISLLTLACLSGPLLAADKGDGKTKNGCVRVVPISNDIQDYIIDKPGSYCVDQDFNVQTGYALSEGWRASVPTNVMLSIDSGDVVIDLQGHQLSTNSEYVSGVQARPVDFGQPFRRRIIIRNGTIDLRGGYGVSLTSQGIAEWDKLRTEKQGTNVSLNLAGPAHQAADRYFPSDYVLENLTIKTSGSGVILVGKNSIVRNCKIEAGTGTVQIQGPGAQVINNEIILHTTDRDRLSVALILHDAEGSVVSGNTITVKGKMKGAQAILLKRSPNVRIENNKINGVAEVYAVDDTPTPLQDYQYPKSLYPNGHNPPRDSGPTSSALLKDNVVNPARSWFPF